MWRFVNRVAAACSVATFIAMGSAAASPTLATLAGVVTAADGARLPGATLLLVETHTGSATRAISTDAGVFRIDGLPPGGYVLHAALDGFEPRQVSGINLAPGETKTITVRLSVATVRETLSVVAAAPRDTIELFQIRESVARDVGEALTALPGLTTVRKGAIASDVVMRGLQGKDVTVLIDGQRIDGACPGRMDPPAFHVDFAEVGRVEVSKGPFDVRNQGGVAGVVNVLSQRPQRGWHGAGNVTAGSFGTLAASATASFGRERWSALAGASSRRAEPYRDGAGVSLFARTNYRGDAPEQLQAYDIWTAWGRLGAVPRAGTTLHLSYTRQSAGRIAYPYLQMDALSDTADRAGLGIEVAELPGGWGTLATSAYFTQVKHWMTDEYRTSAAGMPRPYSMGTRAKTQIAGARADLRRGALSLGLEASRRKWDSRTMLAARQYAPQAALAEATIDVVGAFGAFSRDLGPVWRLEAGARLDRAASATDSEQTNTDLYMAYYANRETRASDVLPVGYTRGTWQRNGWAVSAGLGHAARPPDQQERYYALQRMGSDWVGNPGLRPSRNTGFEGELRYTRRGMDAVVAAYAYRIDDHITVVDRARAAAVPGVINRVARSYANVDALIRGIEVHATLPLSRVLSFSTDASAMRGTTRESWPSGPNLPEMSPARLRVRLRFDDSRWYASAEALSVAGQDRVVTALAESPTPGFSVINLRAGFRLRGVNVMAAVDNVLDRLYAEHLSYQRDPFRIGARVYEPGRAVTVNIGGKF